MAALKRTRLEQIYAIHELRYHDPSFARRGRFQPPRWALLAAERLERVRAIHGRDARIPIDDIRSLRDSRDLERELERDLERGVTR